MHEFGALLDEAEAAFRLVAHQLFDDVRRDAAFMGLTATLPNFR
jgi:hypothetical protein